jgi:hypothetical protein
MVIVRESTFNSIAEWEKAHHAARDNAACPFGDAGWQRETAQRLNLEAGFRKSRCQFDNRTCPV